MTTPSEPPGPDAPPPRAGRCAILGRPNVGKSTLLNALLGQKLAITTARPGTTRSCILGVYASADPPTQIAFLDTPGLGSARTALARYLARQVEESLAEADVIVLMTELHDRMDTGAIHPMDARALELAAQADRPIVLALNKVDRLRDKRRLLPLVQAYTERHPFAAVVPISALRGEGADRLVAEIRQHLAEGRLYEDDLLTDRPERFFAAELVREAVLERTRQEVPHGVAVWIEQWVELEDRARISATIAVEKPNHKKIIIGAGGGLIKEIGTAARKEIERLLGRKVFLELWVKVVPGWTGRAQGLHRMLEGEKP